MQKDSIMTGVSIFAFTFAVLAWVPKIIMLSCARCLRVGIILHVLVRVFFLSITFYIMATREPKLITTIAAFIIQLDILMFLLGALRTAPEQDDLA